MSEFKDWYNSIPYFTRNWLTLTLFFSIVGKLGIVNYYYFLLNFSLFFNNFHIWRPLTAVFFFPTGFPFLINCYFLYTYSLRLETTTFAGKPADYCYMLFFNWICCVLLGFLLDLQLLMDPMVLSVLYVWSQLNKDVIVTFWFGSRFKAMYLPWVLLGFNVLLNQGGLLDFLGILVGHLSYFLFFKYPQEFGGPALLSTPAFLKQIFPDQRIMGGFGTPPQAASPSQARPATNAFGGHNWGRGHTLGGN